jgi:hypothetical protein
VATFRDITGREWRVEFDAFTLDDIRQELQIDLADPTASGFAKIEADDVALVKVLSIAVRDELRAGNRSPRDFARDVVREAIESARESIVRAAENFFPPKRWSEIQSNWEKRRTNQRIIADGQELAKMLPVLKDAMRAIEALPPEMKDGAILEMREQIQRAGGDDTTLQQLRELASVSTPGTMQSSAATDSPESVESVPAA